MSKSRSARRWILTGLFLIALGLFSACAATADSETKAAVSGAASLSATSASSDPASSEGVFSEAPPAPNAPVFRPLSLSEAKSRYANKAPGLFGAYLPGIFTKVQLPRGGKTVALTFDACSGGYDKRIIEYLIAEKIPATVFISGQWLRNHEQDLRDIAANGQFLIGNHGLTHRPLTVRGQKVYGIGGTRSVEEAYREVVDNALEIERITGRAPLFFRSGTAHYDETALLLLGDLGNTAVGFAINGDFGATASGETVFRQLKSAKGGEIVLLHMNRPLGGTFAGLKRGVEYLRSQGFTFITVAG